MEKEEVEVAAIIIIEVREDSEVIEEIEEEEEIEEIEEVEDKEEVTEIMNKVEEEEIAKVMDNKKRNHMSIRIQVKLLQIKYKSSKRLSNKKRDIIVSNKLSKLDFHSVISETNQKQSKNSKQKFNHNPMLNK